jgi:hypothetical protein
VTLQQKAEAQPKAEVLHTISLHTALCHLEKHGLQGVFNIRALGALSGSTSRSSVFQVIVEQ